MTKRGILELASISPLRKQSALIAQIDPKTSNTTPDSRLYHLYSYARLRGRLWKVVFHIQKDINLFAMK